MKIYSKLFNKKTNCYCIIVNCDKWKEKGFVWVYIPLFKIEKPEFIKNLIL